MGDLSKKKDYELRKLERRFKEGDNALDYYLTRYSYGNRSKDHQIEELKKLKGKVKEK